MKKLKIICDMDGVLCENTRKLYKYKKPYPNQIRRLNFLYSQGNKIILFTSRKSMFRNSTVKWLTRWNVKYHKLIMDKPKANFYIDDKSVKWVTAIK